MCDHLTDVCEHLIAVITTVKCLTAKENLIYRVTVLQKKRLKYSSQKSVDRYKKVTE